MMRYLELSYTATTLMQMLISLPQLFLLGIWGKISDRKGHPFTLKASIWLQEGRILYDNFYSAAVGLAFILGPVLGGAIKGQIEAASSVFAIIQFANIDLHIHSICSGDGAFTASELLRLCP